MPATERHIRAEGLRKAVTNHQFQDWLDDILSDVPAQSCGHCGEPASAHLIADDLSATEDLAAAVGGGA